MTSSGLRDDGSKVSDLVPFGIGVGLTTWTLQSGMLSAGSLTAIAISASFLGILASGSR